MSRSSLATGVRSGRVYHPRSTRRRLHRGVPLWSDTSSHSSSSSSAADVDDKFSASSLLLCCTGSFPFISFISLSPFEEQYRISTVRNTPTSDSSPPSVVQSSAAATTTPTNATTTPTSPPPPTRTPTRRLLSRGGSRRNCRVVEVSNLVAVGGAGFPYCVILANPESREMVGRLTGNRGTVRGLAALEENWIVAGDTGSKVLVFDVAEQKRVCELLETPGRTCRVLARDSQGGGEVFVSGEQNGERWQSSNRSAGLVRYDIVQSLRPIGKFEEPQRQQQQHRRNRRNRRRLGSPIYGLAIDSRREILFSGSDSSQVQLWDLRTNDCITDGANRLGTFSEARCLCFVEESNCLVVGTLGGTIEIFDVRRRESPVVFHRFAPQSPHHGRPSMLQEIVQIDRERVISVGSSGLVCLSNVRSDQTRSVQLSGSLGAISGARILREHFACVERWIGEDEEERRKFLVEEILLSRAALVLRVRIVGGDIDVVLQPLKSLLLL